MNYEFRPSLFRKPVTYRLTSHSLESSDGLSLNFADIRRIRIFNVRGSGNAKFKMLPPGSQNFVIRPRYGRSIAIPSYTFVSLGNFEDLSGKFETFATAFIRRVATDNRETIFVAGMPLWLWGLWAFIDVGLSVLWPVALALLLSTHLGRGASATPAVTAIVLAAIAVGLYYRLPPLLRDFPQRFDPR